jgi:hypothetical protein
MGGKGPLGAWEEALDAVPIPGHKAREPVKTRRANIDENRDSMLGFISLTPAMTKSRSPGPDPIILADYWTAKSRCGSAYHWKRKKSISGRISSRSR